MLLDDELSRVINDNVASYTEQFDSSEVVSLELILSSESSRYVALFCILLGLLLRAGRCLTISWTLQKSIHKCRRD